MGHAAGAYGPCEICMLVCFNASCSGLYVGGGVTEWLASLGSISERS